MADIDALNAAAAPWFAALVNSIWQSLVIIALVAVTVRFTRGLSASTRYAIWWVTLAATLAIGAFHAASVPMPRRESSIAMRLEPRPSVVSVATPAVISRPAPVRITPETPRWKPIQVQVRWLPVILAGLWLMASFVKLARIFAGIVKLVGIKRSAIPAPERRLRMRALAQACSPRRQADAASSTRLRTPVAAGLYRPVILIPASLLPKLTDSEFDQIALHELAHIARRDDWANLIQRFIEALFVFHPAVRFISRRIDLEREIACDDCVVQQTAAPRAYAQCLTRLVEMTGWDRQSVPAPGATLHKSHIVQRVEKLLDRTRNGDPRVTKRAVFALGFAILAAIALIVRTPALWAFAAPDSTISFHAPHIPAAFAQMRWITGSTSFEVDTDGEIEFRDDDRDVQSVSPGGHFRMAEKGSPDRSYEVKPGVSGGLSRSYAENGRPIELNDSGRRWLTERIPEAIRESGIGAEKRVQRILKQGGAEGVISEIRLIRSDGSKRAYLQELIAHGGLNENQLREAMRIARGVSSDGEKRALLTSVAPQYLKDNLRRDVFDVVDTISSDGEHERALESFVEDDPASRETLLLSARSAGRISSDGEKAHLLESLAQHYGGNEEMRGAWFATVNTISSDGEKRRALSAIIASSGKDRETLAEAMKAASGISSDGERAALLVESSGYYVDDAVVRRNFFAAVDGISSDGEKRKVLSAIYVRSSQSKATLKQTLRSSKSISSDGERAALLEEVAGPVAWDPEAIDEFFQSCDSISSDGEIANVLLRAIETSRSAPTVLLKVLASTNRISSDGEKARVLTQVIHLNSQDAAVRSALRNSIAGVHSDGEYRRLSAAFPA